MRDDTTWMRRWSETRQNRPVDTRPQEEAIVALLLHQWEEEAVWELRSLTVR